MLEIAAVIAVCVAILWALKQYCLPGTPRAHLPPPSPHFW
jgi:hypothetical protein